MKDSQKKVGRGGLQRRGREREIKVEEIIA